MRRRTVKLVALALPAALLVGAIARPTSAAASSPYAFTMALRAVDGEMNKQFHELAGGELTVTGELWVTEKKAQSTPTPSSVLIEVRKRSFFRGGTTVCSFNVTPTVTLFQRRAYSQACGRIEAGTYFLFISKAAVDKRGDAWVLQGSGTLKE